MLVIALAVFAGLCAVPVLSSMSARRDAAEGRVEAALRVVDSRLRHSHAVDWEVASWRVVSVPGMSSVQAWWPGGVRLPRRRPFDAPVTSVSADNRSHPALRQIWTIAPSLDVVQLLTPTATVELAVRPSGMERVIAGVNSSDPA